MLKVRKVIRVTQEDIDNGKRSNACECPLALAICRAFKKEGVTHVTVADHAHVRELLAYMPLRARMFWRDFDGGYRVEPFRFQATFKGER